MDEPIADSKPYATFVFNHEGEQYVLRQDYERLRAMLTWISVTERLPKEYETVLVATDGAVSAGEIRFPFESEEPEEPWWMVFKDRRDTSPS